MKKRYWIYLCLLGLIVLQFGLPFGIFSGVPPALPVIQLPGEVVFRWSEGGEFLNGWFAAGITNTFIGAVIAAIIVLLIAFAARARSRTAEEVPTGFYNLIEMIIEFAYGYVEGSVGKWAKTFFPFFMTFILWIVIANWMELVPLVDAVGKWEHAGELALHQAETETGHHIEGEEAEQIEEEALDANSLGLRSWPFLLAASQAEESASLSEEVHGVPTGKNPEAADWTIVPYVRAAATDLNFTIALAIISVVMTQYYGMKAQGAKYWYKFFPFYSGKGDEIAKSPLAVMDIGVGLLEFISEIFKIVSFAFRLLGNIFAGQVLLFVIAALLPIANLLFWHLEFFVGLLQAAVFALLTLTFMKSATESHHGEEH